MGELTIQADTNADSQVSTRREAASRPCLRLPNVDWKTYSRLLRIFAEKPGVRLAYDRGELEIMSPLLMHDDDARFLGKLVLILTLELHLPLKSGGSTTLRRRLKKRGIEADECFWIENAEHMAGRRRLDLRKDPPPDLAIEVDVAHSSLDRLSIYAALKVPEVWRLAGDSLDFCVLEATGTYQNASHSRAFPNVSPADLLRFVQKSRESGDENPVIREFQEWVRGWAESGK